MKKLTVILACCIFFACNNTNTNSTGNSASTDTAAVNYPYKIDHPDYWETGSKSNTLALLSSLKAWEEGNLDESLKYFADTVLLDFNGPEMKLPNDSLKAILAAGKANTKSVTIDMKDWESVISKDKKQEWVTVWYTQHKQTNDGKTDSMAVINDAQFKDGKIIKLAEYTRALH